MLPMVINKYYQNLEFKFKTAVAILRFFILSLEKLDDDFFTHLFARFCKYHDNDDSIMDCKRLYKKCEHC